MKLKSSDMIIYGCRQVQQVVCPFCDDEFVHPLKVRVFPVNGKTEYEIGPEGMSSYESYAGGGQRGVSIVIQFTCELGHVWDSEFLFHKGFTHVMTNLVREITPEKLERGERLPRVIWRR